MSRSRRAWAFVRRSLVGLATLAGCGADGFVCIDDAECKDGSRIGVCEPTGRCSFTDPECPSGRRYGEHAGSLSLTCVDGGGIATTATSITTSSTSMSTTSAATTSGESSTGDDSTTTTTNTVTTTPLGEDVPSSDEPLVLIDFVDLTAPFANHGSLGGTATCAPAQCPYVGDRAGSVFFDGFDDCLEVEHDEALDTMNGTTVTLWVRRDEDPPADAVTTAIGKPLGDEGPNSWALYWVASGQSGAVAHGAVNSARGETNVASEVVAVGAWSHFALTHDGTTLSLFVNGALVDSGVGPGIGFDASSIFIGCDDEDGALGYHMTGAISDVRVYARVLTQDEIEDLLNPFG